MSRRYGDSALFHINALFVYDSSIHLIGVLLLHFNSRSHARFHRDRNRVDRAVAR